MNISNIPDSIAGPKRLAEGLRDIKHYVDAAITRSEKNIVNFSAESKSSKEVSDGVTKIYPNTVAKTVVFETIDNNEFKTITIDPSAGTISLANGSISGISDSAGNDSTVALSQCALIDVLEHTHTHWAFRTLRVLSALINEEDK